MFSLTKNVCLRLRYNRPFMYRWLFLKSIKSFQLYKRSLKNKQFQQHFFGMFRMASACFGLFRHVSNCFGLLRLHCDFVSDSSRKLTSRAKLVVQSTKRLWVFWETKQKSSSFNISMPRWRTKVKTVFSIVLSRAKQNAFFHMKVGRNKVLSQQEVAGSQCIKLPFQKLNTENFYFQFSMFSYKKNTYCMYRVCNVSASSICGSRPTDAPWDN